MGCRERYVTHGLLQTEVSLNRMEFGVSLSNQFHAKLYFVIDNTRPNGNGRSDKSLLTLRHG